MATGDQSKGGTSSQYPSTDMDAAVDMTTSEKVMDLAFITQHYVIYIYFYILLCHYTSQPIFTHIFFLNINLYDVCVFLNSCLLKCFVFLNVTSDNLICNIHR